jgi:hypothetical protein
VQSSLATGIVGLKPTVGLVSIRGIILSKLTAGVTSIAPLWEGQTGNGMGDADFYHHDLIEKYGLNYMPPIRTRFEKVENPPAGTKVWTAADRSAQRQGFAASGTLPQSSTRRADGRDLRRRHERRVSSTDCAARTQIRPRHSILQGWDTPPQV